MNRKNITFYILPLCYHLGNPVLMACSGPLLETLDPILPSLPPRPLPGPLGRYLTPTGQTHAITMEKLSPFRLIHQ